MYIVHKKDLPIELARKHTTKYKDELKKALLDPSLTAKQRTALSKRLKNAGSCRNYKTEKPIAGAINNK